MSLPSTQTEGADDIIHLPIELYFRVFELLDNYSWAMARRACKLWYSVYSSDIVEKRKNATMIHVPNSEFKLHPIHKKDILNKKILILAPSSSGKTTLCRQLTQIAGYVNDEITWISYTDTIPDPSTVNTPCVVIDHQLLYKTSISLLNQYLSTSIDDSNNNNDMNNNNNSKKTIIVTSQYATLISKSSRELFDMVYTKSGLCTDTQHASWAKFEEKSLFLQRLTKTVAMDYRMFLVIDIVNKKYYGFKSLII